jgi:hypothetical protein
VVENASGEARVRRRLVGQAGWDVLSWLGLLVAAFVMIVPGAAARSAATTVVSFTIAEGGIVGSGLLEETGPVHHDGSYSVIPAAIKSGVFPLIRLTRGTFGSDHLKLQVIGGRYYPDGTYGFHGDFLRLRVTVIESDDASCKVGAQGIVEVGAGINGNSVSVDLCSKDEAFHHGFNREDLHATVTELRCTQSAAAGPGCSALAPTTPTTMTLTVNGKSATATTAKPSNDDPNPLVVHYGTSLTIIVTANAPMPKGWDIKVHHNGDVLSTGSGDYPVVCTVKTGASSCSVTRPPPTAALTGDVDDVVYAQLETPTGNLRYVQILVYYRK